MISLVFGLFRFWAMGHTHIKTIFHLTGLLDVKAKGLGVCHGSHGKPESSGCGFVWFPFLSSKVMDIDIWWCRMLPTLEMPTIKRCHGKVVCFFWCRNLLLLAGFPQTPWYQNPCWGSFIMMNPFLFACCSHVARCCTPFPRSRAKMFLKFQFQLAAW